MMYSLFFSDGRVTDLSITTIKEYVVYHTCSNISCVLLNQALICEYSFDDFTLTQTHLHRCPSFKAITKLNIPGTLFKSLRMLVMYPLNKRVSYSETQLK